jgi:hypothetical protein
VLPKSGNGVSSSSDELETDYPGFKNWFEGGDSDKEITDIFVKFDKEVSTEATSPLSMRRGDER